MEKVARFSCACGMQSNAESRECYVIKDCNGAFRSSNEQLCSGDLALYIIHTVQLG